MSTRAGDLPARLCLVRHGQGSLGTDDYDRLSELGQSQSQALGLRLREDYGDRRRTWCGSLRRHRQTLAHLATEEDAIIDQALNEYTVDQLIRSAVSQADALELTLPEAEAFADPVAYLKTFLGWFPEVLTAWQGGRLTCEHNGSWVAFSQRVCSVVPDWRLELEAGRSVVVVTSAGVISTIVADLLGQDLAWQRELNIALYNASVTELRLSSDGGWESSLINCISHLENPDLRTLA